MKALTKNLCSDPYGVGCTGLAKSSMQERRSVAVGPAHELAFTSEPITIHLCYDCRWWCCDWDWDTEPEGPFLQGGYR